MVEREADIMQGANFRHLICNKAANKTENSKDIEQFLKNTCWVEKAKKNKVEIWLGGSMYIKLLKKLKSDKMFVIFPIL